jgi:hypothetical protein
MSKEIESINKSESNSAKEVAFEKQADEFWTLTEAG